MILNTLVVAASSASKPRASGDDPEDVFELPSEPV